MYGRLDLRLKDREDHYSDLLYVVQRRLPYTYFSTLLVRDKMYESFCYQLTLKKKKKESGVRSRLTVRRTTPVVVTPTIIGVISFWVEGLNRVLRLKDTV